MPTYKRCPTNNIIFLALLFILIPLPIQAGRIWWDGTRDTETGSPGKLLSDNEGYWGDSILTGVDYHYETPPDNPADVYKDDHTKFGRRLLDGMPAGNWWVPVGVNAKPLVVVFDFKRPCVFREVDLSTQSGKVGITLQSGDTDHGPWTTLYEGSRAIAPSSGFRRLPLSADVHGQFLRLSVDGGAISWLDEVWVWGDGVVSAQYP
ncbi:MAG: hypothetical protein M3Y56_16285, partial [Armatimonadota bacterium]|nr:hypothetical protein [Armatimonadota bacterium]